jgi:hypothetical protein
MIKAERSNYTQCGLMGLGKRVDQPSRKQPETTGKAKFGVASFFSH